MTTTETQTIYYIAPESRYTDHDLAGERNEFSTEVEARAARDNLAETVGEPEGSRWVVVEASGRNRTVAAVRAVSEITETQTIKLIENFGAEIEHQVYGLWDVGGVRIGAVVGVPSADLGSVRASGSGGEAYATAWYADSSDWESVGREAGDAALEVLMGRAVELYRAHTRA